ncbi:chemotaxis protein CheD [Wolinella succinogenes]|uniref:chemotaxis protein CheD n=1 Tax=Wolinella succinogenes TaxID=844 RepID=UPI0016924F33|nr:chemotaxis protein CheD [Wolinella succinogenes]NLU34343.1 chemotaxis protein CheD [Wolinella succinogenes]
MWARKFINVGEIYVAKEPTEIITILGSCVAVCLIDKNTGIAGMNHYLLPLWNGNGLESPKYGNISIPKLIRTMEEAGCHLRNLEAKLFGGSNINIMSNEAMLIGKKNVIIAQEILKNARIPVTAEDTGGNAGRRIMLKSDTGKVILRYTKKEE